MKIHRIIILSIVVALSFAITGCGTKQTDQLEGINLVNGYYETQTISIENGGGSSLSLSSNDGYVSVYVYDVSSDGVSGKSQLTLTLYDADGKELIATKDYAINGVRLGSEINGEYTLECKALGYKGDAQIVLTIAYAEDNISSVGVDGKTAVARADSDGRAEFSLHVPDNSLLQLGGRTALLSEEDCTFSIYDGEDVIVSDVKIHTTEWNSRNVYLPSGNYRIIFEDVEKNMPCECKVVRNEYYAPIITGAVDMESAKVITEDTVLGFTNNTEQWVAINADKEIDLGVESYGINTFYDRETFMKVSVYTEDSLIYQSETDASLVNFTLPAGSGKYYIQFELIDCDNGAVKLTIH